MVQVIHMTEHDLRNLLVHQLQMIAPEGDFERLSPTEDVRRALDIDSFDYLNFLIALEEQVGVAVPEADAGRLSSLDDLVAYLTERMPTPKELGWRNAR